MRLPAFPQPIVAACRRATSFVAGFVREHAPESSVRLCLIMFAATACLVSCWIMKFATDNPDQHLMVGELVGLVGALLGTGCGCMVWRTKSADSAEAKLQQMAASIEQKITDASGGPS